MTIIALWSSQHLPIIGHLCLNCITCYNHKSLIRQDLNSWWNDRRLCAIVFWKKVCVVGIWTVWPNLLKLESIIQKRFVHSGYLTPETWSELFQFQQLKKASFSAAIKRLEGMGASSFVLDLRDNLGGLVQVFLYPLFDLVYEFICI